MKNESEEIEVLNIALKESIKSIEQLCGMVNSYANKLGLGNKVRAEDWIDAYDLAKKKHRLKSRPVFNASQRGNNLEEKIKP